VLIRALTSYITGPVLLVDDDPQIRNLIKSFLSSQGLSTIEAVDGETALAAVHEAGGQIALLLTDVYMGKMNGIELAQAVNAAFPVIPVLFMSGTPVEMLPWEVRSNAFIQKPFSAARLTAAVQGVLGA
jgi:DNA-binding NtrC family response regulator